MSIFFLCGSELGSFRGSRVQGSGFTGNLTALFLVCIDQILTGFSCVDVYAFEDSTRVYYKGPCTHIVYTLAITVDALSLHYG